MKNKIVNLMTLIFLVILTSNACHRVDPEQIKAREAAADALNKAAQLIQPKSNSNEAESKAAESRPAISDQIGDGVKQMGNQLGEGVKSLGQAVVESGQKITEGVKQKVDAGQINQVFQKAGEQVNEHLKEAAEEIKKTGDEIHQELTETQSSAQE